MSDADVPAGRRKKVALAKKLGVEDIEGLSDRELGRRINAAPASAEQLSFIRGLLAYSNLPFPEEKLTFGRAANILDNVAPLVDESVLLDGGWNEGDILLWNGQLFLIEVIHKSKLFTLVRVEPQASGDGSRQFVRTADNKKQHHPLTLHEDGATKIDPATYQP